MINKEDEVRIFKAIPLPMLVLKPKKNLFMVVDVNDAYLRFTNSEREDLIGKEVFDAFPTNSDSRIENTNEVLKSFQKVLSTGESQHIQHIRYDIPVRGTKDFEERHWKVENMPVKNDEGSVEYLIHSLRDITQEVLSRNTNEESYRKKEQLHTFIEENVDALYSLDREGNFISANKKLFTAMEISTDTIEELNFLPFCAPHHRAKVLQHFEEVLKGKTSYFEADFISAKGRKMVLDISLMPTTVNGVVEGAFGIAKDVTVWRQTEKVVMEKKSFLDVNASFISSLLEKDLDYDSLQEAFSLVGKTVKVDRMYYFEAHSDADSSELLISQKVEWTSDVACPQKDNPEMQNMPASQVEEIMGPLFQNKPFSATLCELEAIERQSGNGKGSGLKEIFLEQEIKSMLLLPVFLKNSLYGFVGFDDCTQERVWSQDEISFLQSLTKNLANALEKRSAEAAVKEREEELLKSEQKFKALVQEGSDLLGILDIEGNYTFVSETSNAILKVPPEDFLGKNAFDFIHPEDHDRVLNSFNELLRKKRIQVSPFRFKDEEGNWRWIETTATNMLDDPSVNGIITNSRDITTLINQAREIEEINERYRLAAMATQDLIYDWDLVGDTVRRFHSGEMKLFGYTSEEVNQKKFWRKHIKPEQRKEIQTELRNTLQDPEKSHITTEYQFRRADGTYAKVIDRGFIIRDSSGKAIRLIGATSDISELKSKEEALKVANDRFNMAMEATNEMIWDWDFSTNEVTRSKAFEELYGYSQDKEYPVYTFWFSRTAEGDRDRVMTSLDQALENPSKIKWMEEYCFIKANGEKAHIIDRAYIIRDPSGKAVRMVGAVLDVTESRQLLQEIRRQNDILKEIAWEQSHVVRAPLARLKGLIYLLEIRAFDEMDRNEIIDNINISANELDEIVRRIVTKTEKIDWNFKEDKNS